MRLRRFTTALIATLAALGVLAPASWAHRAATASELRAMVYHSSLRYIDGLGPTFSTRIPTKCFVAEISTVPGGSNWGSFGFSHYGQLHPNGCHTADGVVILHKIHGRWYVLWEGSAGTPPTKATKVGSGKYAYVEQPVPRAVTLDLFAAF